MRSYLKIILSAVACGTLATSLYSCGKKESVALPRDIEVGILLPEVADPVKDYFAIDTRQYVLDMKDSVATLDVVLRHIGRCDETDKFVPRVFSTDTLCFDTPEIVLLNRDGYPVEGLTLTITDKQAEELSAHLPSPGQDTIRIRFFSKEALTDNLRDSLADVAKNFRLNARVQMVVKPEALEGMLNDYERSVAYWNRVCPSTPPLNMYMGVEYMQKFAAVKKQRADLDTAVPNMTDAQRARFESITGSLKVPSWLN